MIRSTNALLNLKKLLIAEGLKGLYLVVQGCIQMERTNTEIALGIRLPINVMIYF